MATTKKKYFEWAISFWIGIGITSIVNVWKITQNQNAVRYPWIMFSLAIVFISISIFLYKREK